MKPTRLLSHFVLTLAFVTGGALVGCGGGDGTTSTDSGVDAKTDAKGSGGTGSGGRGTGGAIAGTGGAIAGTGGVDAGTDGVVTGTGGVVVVGTGGADASTDVLDASPDASDAATDGVVVVTGTGGSSDDGSVDGTSGTGGTPGTGGDTGIGGTSGTGGTPGTGGSLDAGADGGGATGVIVMVVPYADAVVAGPLISGQFTATVLNGTTATFTMCVSPTTANPSMYSFQPFTTNYNNGMGTYYATQPLLSTLSTCPTMSTVTMPITATGAVNNIGLWLRPISVDGGTYGTVTVEVDSVTVSGDPVGPFTFDSTVQGFAANTGFNFVTGTTVIWQAAP